MNLAPTLLLIEASELIGNLIQRSFTEQSYSVSWSRSMAQALDSLAAQHVHAVIFDLFDEQTSPLQDVEMLSAKLGDIPLLVIAGQGGGSGARVRALELGADDCLQRPFEVDELMLRIAALQRRQSSTRPRFNGTLMRLGLRLVDCQSGHVDGPKTNVDLEALELLVLNRLLAAQNAAVTREALCQHAFGHVDPALLRRLGLIVRALRAKLEHDPRAPQFLLTARGQGLRLVGAIVEDLVTSP